VKRKKKNVKSLLLADLVDLGLQVIDDLWWNMFSQNLE
jgi:hypothetical protein